jgi:hypothetical protein
MNYELNKDDDVTVYTNCYAPVNHIEPIFKGKFQGFANIGGLPFILLQSEYLDKFIVQSISLAQVIGIEKNVPFHNLTIIK